MINFSKYDNIIFDFDGVIVDSNFIKEKCIFQASKDYAQKDYHNNFIEYFIKNNGVPREIKIDNFFSKEQSIQILKKYNNCLSSKLKEINVTNEFLSFINLLKFYNKKLFVLSGATREEVLNIIRNKGLDKKFIKIMGGPKTKEENLETTVLTGKTLFIGDSKKDYEVSKQYNFDFIFMYGYSQFKEWKEFFKDKNILMSIKDLSVLLR
jgi:phosphoglycolate phosphatase-like HAD superfamily hydrolase